MHLDMNAYREVVRQQGLKGAERLLLALNDLVVIKRLGRLPSWFNAATTSQPFTLSFMRDAETFFAFHNAGSILGGLEQESFAGISNQLRLEFKLPAFQNPHVIEFHFDYESALPKRIAVVIGKNGVGKSQALAHFAKSLLEGDSHLKDGRGRPPLINRLLAISSPGETRSTFPYPPRRPRIVYQRIVLGRDVDSDQESSLGAVLVGLTRARETIREKSRWNLFCDTVSLIVPLEEIGIRLRPRYDTPTRASLPPGEVIAPLAESGIRLRARYDTPTGTSLPGREFIALADFQGGQEQERLLRWGKAIARADVCRRAASHVFPLSSGQLTFVRLAAQACLHIENGTVVLFDEPETHLHPNYVSDFVRVLDKLLAETGSVAILATHSPYLVREVPKSQVIVLREGEDRTIESFNPRLKTLGGDIGEISHFVFDDPLFGSLIKTVRHRLQRDPAQAAALLRSLEDELSVEALVRS
jgi:energy-coupling factor transporter ATP-binding protein EcfA2